MITASSISSMLFQLFHCRSHAGLGCWDPPKRSPVGRAPTPCSDNGTPRVPPRCTGETTSTVLTEEVGRHLSTSPSSWFRKWVVTPSYSLDPSCWILWLGTDLQKLVQWERKETGQNNTEQTWCQLHLQTRSSFVYMSEDSAGHGKATLTYCSNLILTRTKGSLCLFLELLTAFKSWEALLP